MNALEQLRVDATKAIDHDLSWEEQDARLAAVLETFTASLEAVRVAVDDVGIVRRWRDNVRVDPPGCFGGENTRYTIIYVPRKQQTLAEAGAAFLECCENVWAHTGEIGKYRDAQAAFKAALKREADNARD